MTSSKPYIIRALYEWMGDNNFTPYLLLNAEMPGCVVPEEYIKDGKIILNIAAHVVHGLLLGNEAIEFKARFSGVARSIYAPMESVLAIYAKENGEGMNFPEETPPSGDAATTPKRGKPNLKIVK